MKFLIAFAAILAVAAAVYVPYSYTPYVSTVPAVYGAHHLYKRQIYSPVAYTGGYSGVPYAAVHYRERRQVYTPTPYAAYGTYPYHAAVHYRERRQVYTPTAAYVSPVAAYSPYGHYY